MLCERELEMKLDLETPGVGLRRLPIPVRQTPTRPTRVLAPRVLGRCVLRSLWVANASNARGRSPPVELYCVIVV